MTGRRAVRQWDERLSRALQFVPGHVGGRVASAQPIRRRGGTLRQASVGSVVAAVPTGIEMFYVLDGAEASAVIANMGDDGAATVMLVECYGYPPALTTTGSPTPYTDWTVAASGNVGNLYYAVYRTDDPGYMFTSAWHADGWTTPSGSTDGHVWCHGFYSNPATLGLTLNVAVDTSVAATSHPFKTAPSSWGGVWQHNTYIATDPAGTSSASPTFTSGLYTQTYPYLQDSSFSAPRVMWDYPPAAFEGGYNMPELPISSTRSSTNSWDSIRYAFGWTA